MVSVLPLDLAFVDKFYESFVNKGGRLQRMFRTLVLEVGGGPPAKVLVDTVYHLVERPFISLPPPFKETGNLVGSVRVVIHRHDFTSAGQPRLGRKKYDPADDGLPLIRCNPFWVSHGRLDCESRIRCMWPRNRGTEVSPFAIS